MKKIPANSPSLTAWVIVHRRRRPKRYFVRDLALLEEMDWHPGEDQIPGPATCVREPDSSSVRGTLTGDVRRIVISSSLSAHDRMRAMISKISAAPPKDQSSGKPADL